MRWYFIDLENVGDAFKRIQDEDYKSSKCFILYSSQCAGAVSRSVPIAYKYFKHVKYIKTPNGPKDCLDFNLALLLGYELGKFKGKKLEVVIVSRDNGFFGLENLVEQLATEKSIEVKFLKKPRLMYSYNNSKSLCVDKHSRYYNDTVLNLIADDYYDGLQDTVLERVFVRKGMEVPKGVNQSALRSICRRAILRGKDIKSGVYEYLVSLYGQEEGARIYLIMKGTKVCDIVRGEESRELQC